MGLNPAYFEPTTEGRAVAIRQDLERRLAAQARGVALGPGGVTGTLIAANAITTGHITAGAITAGTIAADAITATHIAARTITAGKIATGTLTANEIAAGTITATQIATGTLTAGTIAAGAITTEKLAAGAVIAEKITAGTITATQIASGTIVSGNIAAGTIVASNIAAGTITGSLIASATITGGLLAAGAVTADKISVADLSAVSASMGTLTAGVIQGGKIRTAASGARVELGPSIVTSQGTYTGLVGVDANNAVTLLIDAATGNVEIKGTIKSGSSGLGNIAGQINGGTAIVDNTIPGGKLVIDAVTAREIAASTITAVEIAAATITGGKIAAGTITAVNIAAGVITADLIAAGAVTATKISATIAGQNLLGPGTTTFEQDTTGWSTAASWWLNAGATIASSTGGSVHGSRSMYVHHAVTGVAALGFHSSGMTQHFYRAGVTYTFSLWARAFAGAFNLQMFISGPAGASFALQTVSLDGTWRRFTLKWTPTADVTDIVVGMRRPEAITSTLEYHVDAVQVEEGDVATAWKQHIAPATIEGTTITGATIRTSVARPRVQITSAGLDIDKGDTVVSKVTWRRPADNTIASEIFLGTADEAGGGDEFLRVRAKPSSDSGETRIQTIGPTGNQGYVIVKPAFVSVAAGTHHKYVLWNNGTSDYQFAASDLRQKTNVAAIPRGAALTAVRQLQPKAFEWLEGQGPAGPTAGLVAQDVRSVIPEAVYPAGPEGEDRYTIQHGPIIAFLVGAVQELAARVDKLTPATA